MIRRAPRTQVTVHNGHHSSITTSQMTTRGRASLILDFFHDDCHHVGEASPLEGFGQDDFELARKELDDLDGQSLYEVVERGLVEDDAATIVGDFARGFVSPSARFAVESCLLRAIGHKRSEPVWAILRRNLGLSADDAPAQLRTSALVDPLSPGLGKQIHVHTRAGIQTLKFKVGVEPELELQRVREAAPFLPERLSLRLDPNQAWSGAEFEAFLELEPELRERFEFVEDPFESFDDWGHYATMHTLAVDELLTGVPPSHEFIDALGARFVILKPMALGGYTESLAWAEAARQAGARVSVSHLLDGPVALDAVVELAFAVQSSGIATGLGLHPGLEAWTESPEFVTTAAIRRPGVPRAVPNPKL